MPYFSSFGKLLSFQSAEKVDFIFPYLLKMRTDFEGFFQIVFPFGEIARTEIGFYLRRVE